ncbi:MAG TPA: DUF2062 domain-containing protein [Steroidobacteraceae bacterium]|nr:DUF2062 domain-containing protein [Steroidobacteraceae bacterium]
MPRRLLKRLLPDRHSLAQRWYMRPFRGALSNPAYWTLHRRSVIRAVALGLFICFIPLPVHLLLAPLVAILFRANLPLSVATILLVNPFTVVPVFFGAYWVGTALTGSNLETFDFSLTWEWVSEYLPAIWKPFLLGCLVSGTLAALSGYLVMSIWWRQHVMHRYQRRVARLRAQSAAIEQNPTL